MRRSHRTWTALIVVAAAGGCATAPRSEGESDPLEPLNRATYRFNDTADRYLLRPIARGYEATVPRLVRTGISNFFDNLTYPIVIANDVLQGKLGQALADSGRLLLNTTFGLGGLVDAASMNGLEEHDEDFGQTLAVWGVPSGPYLVLPLLGPSTLRDAVARIPDASLDPLADEQALLGNAIQIEDASIRDKLWALDILDRRHRLLNVDQAIREAYDPYLFVREAYLQRRRYQIHDGNPPQDDLYEEFEDFEDSDIVQQEQAAPSP